MGVENRNVGHFSDQRMPIQAISVQSVQLLLANPAGRLALAGSAGLPGLPGVPGVPGRQVTTREGSQGWEIDFTEEAPRAMPAPPLTSFNVGSSYASLLFCPNII